MAKCKCCHRKGFMVETDVNGLCPSCAPYYYLTMDDDLKALSKALQALNRSGKPEALIGRLEAALSSLTRLRPYALAGLVRLPEPIEQIEERLARLFKEQEAV